MVKTGRCGLLSTWLVSFRTKIFICTLDGELSDGTRATEMGDTGVHRLQPTVSVQGAGHGAPKTRALERGRGGDCQLEYVACY
jgi:hypothetical protein